MSDIKSRVTSTANFLSIVAFGCLVAGQSLAGIDGTGSQGIDGTGSQGIDGTGSQGIDGTGSQGIDGTGSQGIDGTGNLLVIGSVDFVDGNFASVLGQSIFSDSLVTSGFSAGDSVAVYGSIDAMTGGIVDAVVVAAAPGMASSYLTGIVDEVNLAMGTAVVSGVTVDYTALLGNGVAPRVGQKVSVEGRVYSGRGMVAEP